MLVTLSLRTVRRLLFQSPTTVKFLDNVVG